MKTNRGWGATSQRRSLENQCGRSSRRLCPPNPPVELAGLYQHLDRANQALGRLDGLTTLLPDTKFFLYLYIQKEALLSSQIEGTQSSFSDLLLFENDSEPSVPIDDVEEVSNYV